jgi:hypothetical protein
MAIGKYYKNFSSFQSTILYIGIIYVPSKKHTKCSFHMVDTNLKSSNFQEKWIHVPHPLKLALIEEFHKVNQWDIIMGYEHTHTHS